MLTDSYLHVAQFTLCKKKKALNATYIPTSPVVGLNHMCRMQRVKVCDEVMSQITPFHSFHGYYPGNIPILWKYPHSVDIICISRKYPYSVDIIHIFGIYLHSVDIICISWKYPHYVDIIRVSWIYPPFMDTIGIVHIKSYLALTVLHVLHSFVLVVDINFGHVASYLACKVHPISHILLIQ